MFKKILLTFALLFLSFSFFAENSPLEFGNPSDAKNDTAFPDNYLMEKPQFTLSYNNSDLIPNWVAWHLEKEDIGDSKRSNDFKPDFSLPEDWYKVTKADYKFTLYGFDRGHVCPSADRTASSQDNSVTFLMTNMVPQSPDCNRITWMHLEKFERELVDQGNEVYIFAGVFGSGGTGQRGYFTEIPVDCGSSGQLKIRVPQMEWKILLVLPEGENDFERIIEEGIEGENLKLYAFLIPNEQDCQNVEEDFWSYQCSVNDIEEKTGYNFFDLLPDDLEEALEGRIEAK